MIISVDAKTDFDKIHDRFMIKKKNQKTLNKLGLKENFLSLVSTKCSVSTNTYRYLQNVLYLQKPRANVILYDERLSALPLRSRIRCKWNITQPQKKE